MCTTYMQVPVEIKENQSPRTGILSVVNYLMCVLVIKVRFSARVLGTLCTELSLQYAGPQPFLLV